jgi:hypothetical protein
MAGKARNIPAGWRKINLYINILLKTICMFVVAIVDPG